MDKNSEFKRKQHNANLMSRFYRGESLQDNASNTWYPPRPLLKKDEKAVKKLYGDISVLGSKKTLKVIENLEIP